MFGYNLNTQIHSNLIYQGKQIKNNRPLSATTISCFTRIHYKAKSSSYFNNVYQHLNSMIQTNILSALILLIIVTRTSALPSVIISSSSKHNSFHLALSLQPHSNYHIYSQKIANNQYNLIDINTNSNPATIYPPINEDFLIVNTLHEGRHIIEYYEPSTSVSQNNDHFHFVEVLYEQDSQGYLMPAFLQRTPGLRIDQLYRCSNTLVSVSWYDGSAHIIAASQETHWTIHQSIDNGHRGKEKGVSFIYAIDENHAEPIRIEIGENEFCEITKETKRLNIQYQFREKAIYSMEQMLELARESLALQRKPSLSDFDL